MSDTQNTETDERPAEELEQEVEDQQDAGADDSDAQEADDDGPEWRKNFDPDKAQERIRKYQSENKNLRDRAKKAEEKAQGSDEKDKRITDLERSNVRYEVGYELGLPIELTRRINGATREEMMQDAEELLKLVRVPKSPSRRPQEALRGGGDPEQEPEETDLDKIAERALKR